MKAQKYVVEFMNNSTGEIEQRIGKFVCSSKKFDGSLSFVRIARKYSNNFGTFKEEIDIRPDYKLVSILTSIKDSEVGSYQLLDGIPDDYTLINLYEQIY